MRFVPDSYPLHICSLIIPSFAVLSIKVSISLHQHLDISISLLSTQFLLLLLLLLLVVVVDSHRFLTILSNLSQ
jgi:hypothetical protein